MQSPARCDRAARVVVRPGTAARRRRPATLLPDRVRAGRGRAHRGASWPRTTRPATSRCVDLPGLTLLPGLIDCHAHLVGEEDSGHGYTELLTRTGAQEAMTGVRNARDTLLAGFTTVRDVGTYRAFVDVALRDAIDAGWTPGPADDGRRRLRRLPGGGGDISGLAPDAERLVPAELRVGVVDTVDDVRRVVRRILYGGADLIKLIATGRGDVRQRQPRRAGADRGADPRRGRGGRAARRPRRRPRPRRRGHQAGGPGRGALDRARLADGRRGRRADGRAGTWLVADIYGGDYIAEVGRRTAGRPTSCARTTRRPLAQREAFEKCVAAGVRIAYGTDSGIYPHGLERPPARLPRAARPDAARGDPVGDPARRRADGLVGPDRAGRAGPVRRPGRRSRQTRSTDVRLLEDVRFVMKGGAVVRHP